MFSQILVPLDGSPVAEQVLPFARNLSEGLNVPVRLISVIETRGFLTLADRARHFDALVEEVAQASSEYLQSTAGDLASLPVDWVVEQGDAAETIVDAAAKDKTTLIAMATHGHSGLARWMVGSVAEKVLRGSDNPMLLVKAAETGSAAELPFETIIAALDGSELAETILPTAAHVARALDLELVLARAAEIPPSAYYRTEDLGRANDFVPTYDELLAADTEEARQYLDRKTAELAQAGVRKVRPMLLIGAAAQEIINLAQRTRGSLIAMCTHGRSGVARWVLGSVTEKVVHYCGSPVLVLRPGA